MSEIIGGINPVLEALGARTRSIHKIYLALGRSGRAAAGILASARDAGIRVQRVDRRKLDQMFGGSNHQGVVAEVSPLRYHGLDEWLDRVGPGPVLALILDGVEDPMNLGSLLRSADAAGAAGVILPRERSAPLSGAAIKASAGAAEYVPVVRVVNLARTLADLKQEGFWLLGTDASAPDDLFSQKLPDRLGLVIGGEGKGIRRLVKEHCDLLVSIPLAGRISSLNASVAGALAMFEYVRQKRSSQ